MDAVDDRIEDIWDLYDTGTINKGRANSLVAKLEAALRKLASGDTATAINMIEAFINEVEAHIRSGKLTPEEG